MSKRHKVFTSFHHDNDDGYRKVFEFKFDNKHKVIIYGGVQPGDIPGDILTETVRQKIRDEYLQDTSVTVVLVGTETWKRKHVDWEIYSSLRKTDKNPRSGLLGLLLPSYQKIHGKKYEPYTIPPRLHYNVECDYALLKFWTEDPDQLQAYVHDAWLRKSRINPDNSYPTFGKNRTGDRWHPA